MPQTTITHPLRRKIFLRFTLLVGVSLIATGIASVLITRHAIEERIFTDLEHRASERGRAISQSVDSYRTITKMLSGNTDLASFLEDSDTQNSEERRDALRVQLLSTKEQITPLTDISILDMEGQVRASTDSTLEGESLSVFPHFIIGKLQMFSAFLAKDKERRFFAVSSPMRDSTGKIVGVLLTSFNVSDLYGHVGEFANAGTEEGFLFVEKQENGIRCFSAQNSLIPIDLHLTELCRQDSLEREGILEGLKYGGRPVIALYRSVPEADIGLIAVAIEEEVFASVSMLLAILIGTTAVLLLLVIFIALRLSREVTVPILSLKQSLSRLNTGHFSHIRSIRSGDELEVLDLEISKLAVRLKDAYSSLEERVKERTEALAQEHEKDAALLESIGEGVLAVNREGKIVTCNAIAEEMLHWNREEVIGAQFSAVLVLRGKDQKPIPPREHFVQHAMQEKVPVRTSPQDIYFCERKDGSLFPVHFTATPFLVNREMRGVVVTFRDVTEEKRIDRMKSEFISLASHQLRTPLTAIGWYVELLEGEIAACLTVDQREYIEQVQRSYARIVDLVDALLNVSRIELGQLTIDPSPTDVLLLIENMLKELTPQITEKKLTLTQDLPSRLNATIDPRLLQIVLENLVSNAIKYTPSGGEVTLSLITDPTEMQFTVKDSGIGIPRHQKEKVFHKLFRADNIQKLDTDGTGIGLYIAKETVLAWGGRIWFESEDGKGTTFHFTAPLVMKKVGEGEEEG